MKSMQMRMRPGDFFILLCAATILVALVVAFITEAAEASEIEGAPKNYLASYQYECPNGLKVDFRTYTTTMDGGPSPYFKTDLYSHSTGNLLGSIFHERWGKALSPVLKTGFAWVIVDRAKSSGADGNLAATLFRDRHLFLRASGGGFCPLASLDKMAADGVSLPESLREPILGLEPPPQRPL